MGLKEPGLRGSLRNVSVGMDAIPDGVVSRPDDDDAITGRDDSNGHVFNSESDYSAIGARISNNTSGVTRARLYDYVADAYIETIDISNLSSGDAFAFESEISANQDYGIEVDAEGEGYTLGFASGEDNYPYTTEDIDIDIVAQSRDGESRTGQAQAVNDIGNPDSILN